MRKHDRTLSKLAKESNATLLKTSGGHIKLAGAGWMVFASSTPSDHHAINQVRRDIRRALRETHA